MAEYILADNYLRKNLRLHDANYRARIISGIVKQWNDATYLKFEGNFEAMLNSLFDVRNTKQLCAELIA